jgi:hypothetical protein
LGSFLSDTKKLENLGRCIEQIEKWAKFHWGPW